MAGSGKGIGMLQVCDCVLISREIIDMCRNSSRKQLRQNSSTIDPPAGSKLRLCDGDGIL